MSEPVSPPKFLGCQEVHRLMSVSQRTSGKCHRRLSIRFPGREVAIELWWPQEAVCKGAQYGDKKKQARQGGECGSQQDRFKPQVNAPTKMSEAGVNAKAEMSRPSNTERSGNQGTKCWTELEGVRQG
jgi:hypothetical protein